MTKVNDAVHAAISPLRAWVSVGILTLLYACSMLDRTIISMLIGPMKADLGVGDFQLSLLVGLAFGGFYILCGIPLGWIADRFPKRPLIFAGISIWSLGATLCGFAGSYGQMFASRALVGAGEAAISPAAYSIMSSSFSKGRLALPLSIYGLGSPVGSAVGMALAGLIVTWAEHGGAAGLPILDGMRSWQMVFLLTGAPGLLIAWLAFTLPEPPRQPSCRAGGSLKRFVSSNRVLIASVFAAFALSAVASYNIVVWSPEYMVRSFGWSRAQVGGAIGILTLVAPVISHLITGFLADGFFSRGMLDAHVRLYMGMLVLAVPFVFLAYFSSSAAAFLVGLFGMLLLVLPAQALAAAVLQLSVPPDLRGRITGAYLAFVNLAGLTLGPSLVGFLNQYVFGEQAIGLSSATVVLSAIVITFLLLIVALPKVRAAIASRAQVIVEARQ